MQVLRVGRVAFLYATFGVICLVGSLFFSLICLFGAHKFTRVQAFCRELVRLSWGAFIKICAASGYLRVNFDASGLGEAGELIVANHPSLLDVVFFLGSVRNLNCVVKGELGSNIFLALPIRACGYISNADNEAMLAACMRALKTQAVLIFPEGTRTKDEISFHKAPFFVAIKAAVKITPVQILMHPRSLKKDQSWSDVPREIVSYDFRVKSSLDLVHFHAHRPDPVRVRLLQGEILEIYKELK